MAAVARRGHVPAPAQVAPPDVCRPRGEGLVDRVRDVVVVRLQIIDGLRADVKTACEVDGRYASLPSRGPYASDLRPIPDEGRPGQEIVAVLPAQTACRHKVTQASPQGAPRRERGPSSLEPNRDF